MLTINKLFVPDGLQTNTNKDMTAINFITIHNTGNYAAGATAKMHAEYQYNGAGGREASWHYTVDADEIWQSFDDRRMCWHAGDGKGPGNVSSIGIEICVNSQSGFPKACDNAAWLTAQCLYVHGLLPDAVKQHYDWSGKDCPAELRSGKWGVTWADFLQAVQAYYAALEQPLVPGVPSPWAEEAAAWCMANGITDGTRPREAATREELWTMLYRIAKGK